jgi:2-keto-4-pentenoate hydratase/2-oxohepta-3-ene-1,7-dioic acid hydratase in catechol pathway
MKIYNFESTQGEIGYGTADQAQPGSVMQKLRGDLLAGLSETGETATVQRLLAPLDPRAVIGIGLNYRQHATETNTPIPQYPVVFFKNPASVQDPDSPIVLPRWMASARVDYECELAVIIGKRAKNVPRAEALNYVLGYTCANDVSARDWQKEGGGSQWCRGKSFDTFCPLGPCIVTPDEMPNPNALRISTRIGDEVLQDWTTSDMIFDVATLIEFLSGSTTLLPGTVILTGTPHGVGMARTPARFLRAGDSVTVEIQGIGALTNPVSEEQTGAGAPWKLP